MMKVTPPGRHDAPPGLVLLQVDGLGWSQLQKALEGGRLRFLKSLIDSRQYRLNRFYSGLPSTTPAVQAELFFGVRTAVPAFRFLSQTNGDDHLMLDPATVSAVADRMANHTDRPLLRGGASYSNIFIGGARRAHYCIEDLTPGSVLNDMHPWQTMWVLFQHLGKVGRIIGLVLVETASAVQDLLKGLKQKHHFGKELRFIATRIWLCVVLRELLRFWVKRDIHEGVPVICANFIGYDEHAHRRGPGSVFAHWSLTGIDGVLRDIHSRAIKSSKRHYRVVIYSDHGQEAVIPYQLATGRPLSEGLQEAFASGPLSSCRLYCTEEWLGHTHFFRRGRHLLGKIRTTAEGRHFDGQRIVVAAMGPLGHLYLPSRQDSGVLDLYARRLCDIAGVPLVLYALPDGEIRAATSTGLWRIPEEGEQILGRQHPFPRETGRDLAELVRHPDAGDLVLSGWRMDGEPVSFPIENGAHGGPGSNECQGFLLLPEELDSTNRPFWRPDTLRRVLLDDLARRHCHG